MATFFTSNKDEQFFTPFGPGMAKLKLSDTYVNKMNDIIEGLPGRDAPLADFSDNLVGKVDEELLFDDVMKEMFLRETRELISKYAGHIHTGCKLSCVGYLSMPEGIDKEFEEDYMDHHPSHGHIQFVHGTPSHWSATNFMIKPEVGDFYLFPSDLFHCVYPFYTKGERRSFSVNLNFLEMPKHVGDKDNETGT